MAERVHSLGLTRLFLTLLERQRLSLTRPRSSATLSRLREKVCSRLYR